MKYTKNEKYVLFGATLSTIIVAFLLNAAPLALPSIAKTFMMNNIEQNWVDTLYLLSIAVFSVPCGKICQRYGLKRILLYGVVLFLVGVLLTALSQNATMLLLSRATMGIASAILNVASIALIVEGMNKDKMGVSLGIVVAAVYVAIALAPILGGFLITNFGWQSLFYFTIPPVILNYYLIFKIEKEYIHEDHERFDTTGSILYVLGITLFIYGFTRITEVTGQLITLTGAVLLAIFALTEYHAKNPIFNVKLFENNRFRAANLACLLSYIATFMITYVYNYHLQYIMEFTAETAGMFLIITPLIMVFMSLVAGKLIEKIRGEILSGVGLAILSVAFIILSSLNRNTGLLVLLIVMTLHGVGYGLFSAPNTTLITTTVSQKEASHASASLSAMRLIGQSMSLGIFTTVFAAIMQNKSILPEYYGLLMESSHIIVIIAVIFVVLATIVSLMGLKDE